MTEIDVSINEMDRLYWSIAHLRGCATLITALMELREPIEDSALLVIANELVRSTDEIEAVCKELDKKAEPDRKAKREKALKEIKSGSNQNWHSVNDKNQEEKVSE